MSYELSGVPEVITSTANPVVKLARQLVSRRKVRAREKLFLIEGERAIGTALQHDTRVQIFIIDYERRGALSPAFVSLIESIDARIVLIEPGLFRSIVDAEHPQPVAAIASLPDLPFPVAATSIVALDAVRDPGNLGTIVRTAAAAGVDGIALLPGCVDAFHPATVRASAGTITSLPIRQFAHLDAVISTHMPMNDRYHIIAGDADGVDDYRDIDWVEPHILVVGNEAHGLGDEALSATTSLVQIPMAHGVESLNVSVATGVLLFQMRTARDRR